MSGKIKILHVIKSLGRGGAEMLLPETLNLHDKAAFEFHYIYFLHWKDQMVESIQQYGGKVTCFSAWNNIQLLLKYRSVAKYIRDHEIEIIHAHLPWAGVLARLVGKVTRVPVIYTEHNKQERYHWITRKLNLRTLGLCTKVVTVSDDVYKSIFKNRPGLKCPVRTILNGVNTNRFSLQFFDKTTVRKKYNIPTSAALIGTVAVFRFQKRLDLWMEVAKQILQKRPDAYFVIVGDGPLKAELLKKRESLNLVERIIMPGIETEVRPFLAAFDLFMMSSVFEGLPIALLEAMSMECPVIATNAGGIGEVVRHGIDGLLCDVDEAGKLADYALTLLHDADRCRTFGTEARHRIQERFSMENMVLSLEDEYRSVIADK